MRLVPGFSSLFTRATLNCIDRCCAAAFADDQHSWDDRALIGATGGGGAGGRMPCNAMFTGGCNRMPA